MASLLNMPTPLLLWLRERGLQPMAFNDGFYHEDKDDVQFDKDVLILTGLKAGGLQPRITSIPSK